MTVEESVRAIIEPLVEAQDVELVEVDHNGGNLRITVDQPGGIGTEALTQVTRAISRAMDDHDPLPGRYTLEVSSPGLERPLKTAEHFERALGTEIKVKTSSEIAGRRRFGGTLLAVNGQEITVEVDVETEDDDATDTDPDAVGPSSVVIPISAIAKARTVFEWGPAPKPGSPEARKAAAKKKKKQQQAKKQQNSNPKTSTDTSDTKSQLDNTGATGS